MKRNVNNTIPELKAFGFEEFLEATSVPATDNVVAPNEPPTIAVQNVFELASEYGIQFGSGLAVPKDAF